MILRRESTILNSIIILLLKIYTVSSQNLADTSWLADCETGFSSLTQPPQALPCDPYPSKSTDSSSVSVECSVIVPPHLATKSAIVWNKLGEGSETKQLRDSERGNDIEDSLVQDVTHEKLALRSMLQVGGLRLNRTEKVGLYYCQLTLELNDEETIASNASIALEILPSSSYTDLDKCDPDRLFLTLAPACLSLGSNVSLPSTSPPPVVMTTCSDCDDPTPTALTFPLETIIIISSVGGGLAVLVCLLLLVLCITCFCVRRNRTSKSSLRTFKDRAIPLSTSMSNINMVEAATSQSNLIVQMSPVDRPFNPFPAPSHPPPIHTTLPPRLKQTVTQTVSSDGSVTSSTMLIRQGRAATVIGKLRSACTPTEEEDYGMESVSTTNPNRNELYKSLIAGNMDDPQIYSTANISLHGSMESLDSVSDDQPVYSEPTIPLSVSMLSLVSQENMEDDGQPQYAEPTLPHSLSSFSLHSQCGHRVDNGYTPQSRSRLSLPLNQTLAVFTREEDEEQPIYSEVDDTPSPTKQIVHVELNQTSPTRQQPGRKRPVIPPRPPARQPNKQTLLDKEEKLHLPERVIQSDLSIQRESVDGEYVCPNGVLESNKGQSSEGQPWEVVQLRNHDINPPPHTGRHGHEYLTLYVSNDC